MKLRLLLFLISVICTNVGFGQINLRESVPDKPLKNTVLFSFWVWPEFTHSMVQYERIVVHNTNSFFNSVGLKIGVGSIKEWNDGSGINFSTDIFTFFGKKANHLEIGAGIIYIPEESAGNLDLNPQSILPSFTLSYRYQKPFSPFVFRAGTGFIEFINLSIGYCF